MRHPFIACLLSAALALPCAASAAEAVDWRAAAARDLTAMHDVLRDNHPAVIIDKDSAGFRNWIEAGYRQGQADLPRVTDSRGYAYLLWRYARGFRDGHIGVGFDKDKVATGTLAWPGFTTTWSDGRYRVAEATPDGPAKGAVVVSCDGHAVGELARARLDRFEGDLDLPGGRYRTARWLLWDNGNPFAARPETCAFDSDGRQATVKLSYRTPDKAVLDKAAEAASGYLHPPLDVTQLGPRRWLIGMPSMGDDQDWKGFYAKVDANLAALRGAELVVVDVRGNGGGSSTYGDVLATKLWGQPLVDARRPKLGPVTYRVTPLNHRFLADLFDQAAKDPINADDVPEMKKIMAGFDDAERTGKPTFVLSDEATAGPGRPAGANPMRARVVMLTDYACASACLDAMDLFLTMPGVEQAGTQSGADTIFMELTRSPLPSGLGTFVFGHKAWTERPRGSNVVYTPAPALTYRGPVADDAAWKAWIGRTFPPGR